MSSESDEEKREWIKVTGKNKKRSRPKNVRTTENGTFLRRPPSTLLPASSVPPVPEASSKGSTPAVTNTDRQGCNTPVQKFPHIHARLQQISLITTEQLPVRDLAKTAEGNDCALKWKSPSPLPNLEQGKKILYHVDVTSDGHTVRNITKRERDYRVKDLLLKKKVRVEISAHVYTDLGAVYINAKKTVQGSKRVYEGCLNERSQNLERLAIKIVDKDTGDSELEIMRELKDCFGIVKYRTSGLYGPAEDEIYIAMKLYKSETLDTVIETPGLCPQKQKNAIQTIMNGLLECHAKNIFHGDVKPRNILRSLDGKEFKLCDFSQSVKVETNSLEVPGELKISGTPGWRSPEHYLYQKVKKSLKSDVYCAGLVIYFVLSEGKTVFCDENDQKKNLENWKGFSFENLTCESLNLAKDLIRKMLDPIPPNRPSAELVLNHPYFWDGTKCMQFLHQMSSFFDPFYRDQNPAEPDELSQTIINQLEQKIFVIKSINGSINWCRILQDSRDVRRNFLFLIRSADNDKYSHDSVISLLRYIRNFDEHLKRNFGRLNTNEKIWHFFSKTFPEMLCAVYNVFLEHWPDVAELKNFPVDASEFFTGLF